MQTISNTKSVWTLVLEIGLEYHYQLAHTDSNAVHLTRTAARELVNQKGQPSQRSSLLGSLGLSCGLSSLNLGGGGGSNSLCWGSSLGGCSGLGGCSDLGGCCDNLCGGSSDNLDWCGGGGSGSGGGVLLCFLFLGVLGKELLVLLVGLLGVLVAVLNFGLVELFASKTGLGDQALDLGGLVESLVLSLDFTTNNVLANIILLLVESECLNDVVSSLGTESVGAGNVGDTIDVFLTLLDNTELDGGEVGAVDGATD